MQTINLGHLKAGTPYSVTYEAAAGNADDAYVFIAWDSTVQTSQTFSVQVAPGGSKTHSGTVPANRSYRSIEIRISQGPADRGTVTVKGTSPPGRSAISPPAPVEGEECFWLEIA